MSVQIAVSLPSTAVAFLDHSVAAGEAPSRAALITIALERELRHRLAMRDTEIPSQVGPADELDDLVLWSGRSFDDLD